MDKTIIEPPKVNTQPQPVITIFLSPDGKDIRISSPLTEQKIVLNILIRALEAVVNTERKEPSKIIKPNNIIIGGRN